MSMRVSNVSFKANPANNICKPKSNLSTAKQLVKTGFYVGGSMILAPLTTILMPPVSSGLIPAPCLLFDVFKKSEDEADDKTDDKK